MVLKRNNTGGSAPVDPQDILHRARWFWRICLILPFLYVAIAGIVHQFYFADRAPFGLWPMDETAYRKVLIVFGILAFLSEVAIIVLHTMYQKRLREVRLMQNRAAALYWRRTILMSLCADLVSGLGLIAFLIHGDWMALSAFCILSYFLYVQAYPRARYLE